MSLPTFMCLDIMLVLVLALLLSPLRVKRMQILLGLCHACIGWLPTLVDSIGFKAVACNSHRGA